jgi:radical SAM protein with 4Fe4S-binding SPASM domain
MMYNFQEFRDLIPKKEIDEKFIRKCPAGIAESTIGYSGNVYPCSFMMDPSQSGGNILERSLLDIWADPTIWQELRKGRCFDDTKCEKCGYLYRCKGGCAGSALSVHGTINAPDPLCTYDPITEK